MKKLIAIAILLGLSLGWLGSTPIYAATSSNVKWYEINVNGVFISSDVQPLVSQSSLLIPIRALASLGLSNSWDASSRTVTIKNTSDDVLTITLDSNIALKNGKRIEMSVPAQSKHGRVLVPIRFVSESLGYQVHYETIRNIIFVTSPDYTDDSSVIGKSDFAAARRAAISLPIKADFKTLESRGKRYDYGYSFPPGRADTYKFLDGDITTIVKIENGKAIAIGQYAIGDRSNIRKKAGNITGENIATEPLLEPFSSSVNFFHDLGTSTTNVSYWEVDSETDDRTLKSFTNSSYKVYSDIIQEVPNNL